MLRWYLSSEGLEMNAKEIIEATLEIERLLPMRRPKEIMPRAGDREKAIVGRSMIANGPARMRGNA